MQQFHVLEDLDWTYKDSFNIWNYVEFTIGILAASLPTLKPLFNWALETARAITSAGRTHGSGRGATQGANSLGYHKHSEVSSKSVELQSMASKADSQSQKSPYNVEIRGKQGPMGIAERDLWENERGKSSEESILPLQHPEPGKNRIVRTTEVHVS